jgi:hypothetical protein
MTELIMYGGYDRVPHGCECPRCGEDNIDALIMNDDDTVTCYSCFLTYSINEVSRKIFCIVCRREKTFPTEGRVIDMSWSDDVHVPEYLIGKWVCCYNCYAKVITNKQ